MAQEEHYENEKSGTTVFLRWVGRLIMVAIVLAIVSFVTPGFTISGLWSYLLAALVICALDYLAEWVMKIDASPFGKGVKGFIIAALILYLAQFIVPNMTVTLIGAVIGALLIGVLDAIFPSRVM